MKNDYDTDLDVMFCWGYGFINDPVCSMESDGKKELKKSDDEKNVMNAEQKKIGYSPTSTGCNGSNEDATNPAASTTIASLRIFMFV